MKKRAETPNVYQLKIELKGTKPQIWRRVLIPCDITFSELHEIIQTVMGWSNDHLYSFQIGDRRNGITIQSTRDPMGGHLDDMFSDYDAEKITISKFLLEKKDKVSYEYDFGDSWEHTVILEKILSPEEVDQSVPVCIAGALRCPPEDCGGVWGFHNLKEALEDKKHSHHLDMLEWMGNQVPDWDHFSVEETNDGLSYFRKKVKKRAANE